MQNSSDTVLVIDVGNSKCDGRLHDRDFLNKVSHTLLPIYALVKACERLGIQCVTPDAVLTSSDSFTGKRRLLVSHLISNRTDELIATGCIPFLLTCQESPFIATRFYMNFRSHSDKFLYTTAFSGMKRRASKQTAFLPMRFPIFYENAKMSTMPFSERRHAVLVAGNKRVSSWKIPLLRYMYGTEVQLAHPRRRKLIENMSKLQTIDIYGRGWENDPSQVITEAYRGPLGPDEKFSTVSQYKFTICFENAIFPGYLTEKLFDAFLSHSVPIYLGDPEIECTVPTSTFVDARNYKSVDELDAFLSSMTQEEHSQYITAAQTFLSSKTFFPFTHHGFTQTVIDLVHNYVKSS